MSSNVKGVIEQLSKLVGQVGEIGSVEEAQ